MKILLIADIHYGEDTNYPAFGGADYVNSFGSKFDKFLPDFLALASEHDLIINLGDLIKDISPENDAIRYQQTLTIFEVRKPVKHVIGNHELNTILPLDLARTMKEDNVYYSFELGGYCHIVLSAQRLTRQDPWIVEKGQVDWLRKVLEETRLPALVYCHFPLDEQDLESNYYFKGNPVKAFISNRWEIRSILEQSDRVIAVFNGHLHFYHSEKINGISYITVPAFTENDGSNKPQAQCLSVSLWGMDMTSHLIQL